MRAFQGQFERAEELLNDSLQMAEEAAGREVAAFIIDSVATAAYLKGDLERARTLWEETEASFRNMDDSVALAYTLSNLGMLAIYAGNYERAETLLREGNELIQQLGEKRGIALSYHLLARLAYARDDLGGAYKHFIHALHLRYEMGDKRGVAETVEGLAAVLAASGGEGDVICAAEYLGMAEFLREKIGVHIAYPERALRDRTLTALHSALGATAFEEARTRGREKVFDNALREILAVEPHPLSE
jgi:ATP/maltotriose-dependent transcriptional regulator MalT